MRTAWDGDKLPPPDGAMSAVALAITARQAGTLSFVAGYVDTCIFIALFGLFTAHVTGNLVIMGSALVHSAPEDVFPKVVAFGAFAAAVVIAVLLDRWLDEPIRIPMFLVLEGSLLLLVPLAAGPAALRDPNAIGALIAGALGAAAMGFQNAMMRLRLPATPSTTVMTTNVTQGLIDAATLLLPQRNLRDQKAREEARARARRMWPQIGWFTLGAAGGALGFHLAGLAALFLPALLCDLLAWRMSRGPAAA